MELPDVAYKVSYRQVKYPRLEFRTSELLLILPFGYDPNIVLEKKRGWIRKKAALINDSLKYASGKEIVDRTYEEFKDLVHFYVEEASGDLGVEVRRIFFREMKTKWASCSSKKNLTINKLMRCLPNSLVEYVIFHETAHLIEKRHSDKFWDIISSRFDGYEKFERELFTYWFLIHTTKESVRRKRP